ncbi:MAG TPA: 50S ribosomal protein L30 [Dehalococcoidia bacterium]|nr:50S ribosomal protein L30 [Dehalococcoidia bacterium]
MANLEVRLKKSLIGYPDDQRQTARALGLRRLGHSVTHTDSPTIRGMLNKIRHLVEVDEKG